MLTHGVGIVYVHYSSAGSAQRRNGSENDTSRLELCTTRCDPGGYVSIIPGDGTSIADWASTKGSGVVSPYTQDIKDAIIGSAEVPKS